MDPWWKSLLILWMPQNKHRCKLNFYIANSLLTADRGVIYNSVKPNIEQARPTGASDVSHSLQSWVSTTNSIGRTHSSRFQFFFETVTSFDAFGTWFYYYCCGVYLAYSCVRYYDLLKYMHDVALYPCHMEVNFKSVVIDCCTTTAVHLFFWQGAHWNFRYVLPRLHAKYYLWIPQFPGCDIDVQQMNFPESNFHRIYVVQPFIVR